MEVCSHKTIKSIKAHNMLMWMSTTRKINSSNETSFVVTNKVFTVQLCTMLHTINNTHKAMLVVDQGTTRANISIPLLALLVPTNNTLNSTGKIVEFNREAIFKTKALHQIRDKRQSTSNVEIFISNPMLHNQLFLAHNYHHHPHNHLNLLGGISLKVGQHYSNHSNPHQPHGRPLMAPPLVKAAHQVIREKNTNQRSKRMLCWRE